MQIGKLTEFIVGDRCDQINPLIEKYFKNSLGGHNTCFEVKTYLLSGYWTLLSSSLVFFISSYVVKNVFRKALYERMPDHVKEYLENKKNTKEETISIIDERNTKYNDSLIQPNVNNISNINNTRYTDNKELDVENY